MPAAPRNILMRILDHGRRAVWFAVGFVVTLALGTAALFGQVMPTARLRCRWILWWRRLWAKTLIRILRIRVRLVGPGINSKGPALYVANHTGYLDTLVLLYLTPADFISREHVAWWPVLGQLVLLAGTLFVDRRDRFSVAPIVARVRERLLSGRSIAFFPEGTSTNGETIIPFKSSLFAAAEGRDGVAFPIRPIVVKYASIAGKPVTPANRDLVYWYGDMGLLGHLWSLLGAGVVEVEIKALPERFIDCHRRRFCEALRGEMMRELGFVEPLKE